MEPLSHLKRNLAGMFLIWLSTKCTLCRLRNPEWMHEWSLDGSLPWLQKLTIFYMDQQDDHNHRTMILVGKCF